MLKIGITGSNNTGKTTLANKLAGMLSEMGHKADVAQENVKYCPIGDIHRPSIGSQMWLLGTQIQHETVIATYDNIIVCDKTAIDTLAYAIWAYKVSPINKQGLELLKDLALRYSQTYDELFLLPVLDEIPYSQWVKGTDHRKEVDYIIREILDRHSFQYAELKSPLGSRAQEAIEILKQKQRI